MSNIFKKLKQKGILVETSWNTCISTLIFLTKGMSHQLAQPYVFAFTSNFRVFSDLDISKNEFRVLTYILEYMEFGNLINLSQSSLCKALNIASVICQTYSKS